MRPTDGHDHDHHELGAHDVRPVGSRYLLEEPLGRGATGTVWRARVRGADPAADPVAGAEGAVARPGEVVAIKVLKEELAGDPDVVMRFLRERSALLRLSHPNIVRVRDLVVEGQLLALVMDLIEGPDLHRYVRQNGPFSPTGVALLIAQVADALAASHADGVVHRDLKPANVLLATSHPAPSAAGRVGQDGPQMHPMLTDFGIARLADSPGVTRTHEFVGTPAYVAPESAEGRPQTSAVDVYGAGILMYELVTGYPPFRGDSALEVLHQHLDAQPRRPSTVPDPLWTVIERCLRKDPAERPSAANLARALRVVSDGIGVHATPEAAEAAFGVVALLGSDPDPARVPGTGNAFAAGAAEATQVLPGGSAGQVAFGDPQAAQGGLFGSDGGFGQSDPNAATSVLPQSAVPPGAAGGTRLLPPVPDEPLNPTLPDPQAQQPQGPHPWQTQLDAARLRNEQTEIRYLDPEDDPLRHRPHRQPAPAPAARRQQPAPPRPQQEYQQSELPETVNRRPATRPQAPPQRYEPQSSQVAPRRREPQRYEPDRYEPDRYEPARPPERRPAREPAPRREPRRRSRMRIPGAGCLKGFLFMVLILVVIAALLWNFTPLPDWVAQGRSWWQTASDWGSTAWHWVSHLGSAANRLRRNG